jgi:hypothetical protein
MQAESVLNQMPASLAAAETGEWRFRLCAMMVSALLVAAMYSVFLHKPSEIVVRDRGLAPQIETARAPIAAGLAQN